MSKLSLRLQAIKEILSREKVANQEELLQRLQQKGFNLTQATVSRDLKRLQVGKKPDPGKGSVFFINDPRHMANEEAPLRNQFLLSGIRDVLFANMFGIIKTLPGFANSIAVHIDKSNRPEIIGTIAGDDTILLIPGQGTKPEDLKNALQLVFPGIQALTSWQD